MSRMYFHQTPEISDNLSDNIIEAIKTGSIAEVISFLKTTKGNFLPWNYGHEQPNVLLIPAILDASNSVSYDGVEFALQWYFYKILNNKEFAIILLGIESKAAFFEHCDYSFVIKCPNIHYVEFSMDEIKRSVAEIQPKSFEKEQYIQSLKNIGIKPPTSYKSHHSITNEWSIYRWSKYLGLESQLQKTLDKEIKNSLYYNYLQTIYPIDETDSQKYKILEKGNILLVDDEVDKGWDDFFKELATSNQKFRAIGENFKKLTAEEIIETSINEVETIAPDVVILDLRLHDDDFDKKPTEGLSGIKILQKIKSINQGIQVLAFTASNKIWNYQKLQQIGIDGFILKESPVLSQDKDFTENAIKELRSSIEKALERKYLKYIFLLIEDITKHIHRKIHEKTLDKKFGKELIKLLDISFIMLYRAKKDIDFAFSYLALFKCLELIVDEFVFNISGKWEIVGPLTLNQYSYDETNKKYFKKEAIKFKNIPPSTFQKIAGLSFQLWQYNDLQVQEIFYSIKRRNEFIHPSESELSQNLKKECMKIYKSDGYEILVEQIENIIKKM